MATDAQIASAAKTAGFPADQIATAVAISLAESSGRQTVTHRNSNGTTDYGLWQINSVHGALLQQGDWRNPVDNAKMALQVSGGGTNWKPWSTFNNGSYLLFLPRGKVAAGNAGTTSTPGVTQTGLSLPSLPDFSAIVNPHSYLRIGMFILGGGLVLLALKNLANDNGVKTPEQQIRQATKKKSGGGRGKGEGNDSGGAGEAIGDTAAEGADAVGEGAAEGVDAVTTTVESAVEAGAEIL